MAAGDRTPASATPYPGVWEADVLLRDGHPVHLRPITPADGDALRGFHASLSDRTVYFRFFSVKPALTDEDVAYFTGVDHHDRVALIALDAGILIGVARYDALGDGSAEVAFVIRDDVQGLGLGSILLEHLAAAARECGVRRFVAEVLPDNGRMVATFREAGFDVTQRREEDVLAVSFDIEPTETSRAVTSAREHRAEARSVHRLLHPSGVAVVGVSRHPGGLGQEVLRHLVDGGYRGTLVAVHPDVDMIAGVPCVRSLMDVPDGIDLAVVVVPALGVAGVIRDAARAEVHGLVVVSGGFGDVGGEGPRLQEELVALVHGTGMRLVGPNALGLINTDEAVRLNASLVPTFPIAGKVGLFSQSGALGGSILERFQARGLGVSTFVSAGNRADISGNDLLQYWEQDPRTTLVGLYLETMGNARKFARIVHRLSATKPVVMVRSGGSGQQQPLGHDVVTTRLSQRAVDQILGDCGLVLVESIDEMIDVARLAVSQPVPRGPGVAIVGNSDALSVLAVNALDGTLMTTARPPVTFPRRASIDDYAGALGAAIEDPGVGIVIAVHVPPIESPADTGVRDLLGRLAASDTGGVPIVAVMPRAAAPAADVDVPVFIDIEDAVRAAGAYVRLGIWREADARRRRTGEAWPDRDDGGALAPGVRSGAEAREIARRAAVPITLASGPRAAREGDAPGCRVRLVHDPLYGPVVVVGVDDPVAEVLDDRSYRLAPVSSEGAAEMVAGLRALSVLAGGGQAGQVAEIARLVVAVSRMPALLPGIAEADLRHARAGATPGGDLTVADISVTVAAEPADPDPAARRL